MSRRSRRRNERTEIKLTPEGWVFLVVLAFITVGAVLRNVNLLVVLAGMMYAPLLLNWRLAIRWLKSFNASRRIPTRLHANDLVSVQWTCENQRANLAAWNLVINDRITRLSDEQQTIQPVGSDESPGSDRWWSRWFGEIFQRLGRGRNTEPNRSEVKLGFVRVDAGRSAVQSYRVFFAQRGKYLTGPAALSTTFPFGLIVSRIHFPQTDSIYVGPEIGVLHPTWERRVQSIASGSDTIKRRRALEEDQFYALRPWRSGDCKKNIHWRTSAKYGQPIVKQYDQQNNRDFALLLDLHFDPDDENRTKSLAERALSFAATVILQIGNAVQGQIAIGVCGRETELCHSRSHQGIVVEVMKRLAIAHPIDQPQTAEMLVQLSHLVSNGTPIYIVSSRPRPSSLDPSQLQTDTGNLETDRAARRLKQVLPLLRWLEVGTEEFDSMFSIKQDSDQDAQLQRFSSRWSADAKR